MYNPNKDDYNVFLESFKLPPSLECTSEQQWAKIPKTQIEEPYSRTELEVYLVHSIGAHPGRSESKLRTVSFGFPYVMVVSDTDELYKNIPLHFGEDSAIVYVAKRLDVLPFTNAPLF